MDKILIEGLTINAIIGILPHEREFEQPLKLDIILEHDIKACAKTDKLDLSINYAQVAQEVTEFVQQKQAYLIESLAEELCAFILERFQPQVVSLKIMKTQAVVNTQGVGVQITRELSSLKH